MAFGTEDMVSPLRRVLVREPATSGDFVADGGWRLPDVEILKKEHARLCGLLTSLGAEVVIEPPLRGQVDAVYVHDPVMMSPDGAIVLRQKKPIRHEEASAMEEALRRLDVPIIGRLPEGAFMDGGDKVWFDARTLFVGRSHRTNDDAIGALRAMLGPRGVDVHAFDLPNYRGPDTVLHLMSVLSPVDHDLAVVYEPLAPVALLDALRKRGIDWLTLDDEEFATQGSNVLALAPRRALLVAGNDRIAAALRGRGAEVHTFSGEHLAIRGDGGPTCLTQPIHREK